MSNERAEWEACQSYLRFYVALNETLPRKELKKLLRNYTRQARLAEKSQRRLERMLRDESRWFQVLTCMVELLGDDGRSFLEFVRQVIHEPPEGFDKIGRFGNQKAPGPSPSIRAHPLPDPDENRRHRRERF